MYKIYEVFETKGIIEEFLIYVTDDKTDARRVARNNNFGGCYIEIRFNETENSYETLNF